jgi:hypothetical protein
MLVVVRKTRKIMQQPSLAAVIDHEISPGADAEDDEALAQRLRSEGATMYHQCGTCRMDTALRVRGVARPRVADASIIPIIPNANTHAAPIMMSAVTEFESEPFRRPGPTEATYSDGSADPRTIMATRAIDQPPAGVDE